MTVSFIRETYGSPQIQSAAETRTGELNAGAVTGWDGEKSQGWNLTCLSEDGRSRWTISMMEEDGQPKALPVIWIAPHSGAFDFHFKYTKGATDYHCPAPFDEATTAYIQGVAKDTYKLLGLSGVARVDAILGEDGVHRSRAAPPLIVTD